STLIKLLAGPHRAVDHHGVGPCWLGRRFDLHVRGPPSPKHDGIDVGAVGAKHDVRIEHSEAPILDGATRLHFIVLPRLHNRKTASRPASAHILTKSPCGGRPAWARAPKLAIQLFQLPQGATSGAV